MLELTYTAWDLQPFSRDLGYDGPPFSWDDRRALLRAELDAYYAALYGLTRDDLRYILDPQEVYGPDFPGETFRVLKQNEIRKYGEYRTRRLVLEAWDRLGLEPRNRDGRYEVEPAARIISAPVVPKQVKPVPAARTPESRVSARTETVGAPDGVRPNGKPMVQPPLEATRRTAPGSAQPRLLDDDLSDDADFRRRVLGHCLDALRGGPLSGRDLASRLVRVDMRIGKRVVNSVLHSEGAGQVERDAATGRYSLKPASDQDGR